MLNRIDDLIFQLHTIHEQLNKKLFNNELHPVEITVENGFRANRLTLAHFYSGETWEGNHRKSIVFWYSVFRGDYYFLIETLVHEMCHQYNFEKGIKDVENNQRHNKHFKEIAERSCLEVTPPTKLQSKKYLGYMFTSGSPELRYIIDNELEFDRELLNSVKYNGPQEKVFYNQSRTYSCPNCNQSIRTVKEVNLICGNCKIPMISSLDKINK